MIVKLRRKFVAISMALLTLVMAALFAVVMVSTQNSLLQDSHAALEQALTLSRDKRPDLFDFGLPGQSAVLGEQQVQLPYLTVEVASPNRAYILHNQFFDTSDQQVLLEVINQALEDEDGTGTLHAHGYHLRFLRADTVLGTRLAFVDLTQERSTMAALGRNMAFISLGALAVFFAICLLLARWATRPVEQSWQQQRQFVADASHELKTPLTVILSSLDMLDQYGGEDPEKAELWLDNIRSSSTRMRKLVEEMLVLARSDNATQQFTPGRLEFSELIQECVLQFEPIAFESGKALEEQIQPELFVIGDPALLGRVAAIYLDNACKYGAAGSRISVTLRGEGKRVVLGVRSEGTPIPKDQQERVFERFYRLDPSRTDEGYGLGLAIAGELARLHQGKVWCTADDTGNTFWFSLPREK